jgi:hypothetical protein
LIVQAQQQPGFNGTLEVSEPGTPRVVRPALSTIYEKSERTEASPYWPNRQPLLNTPRPLSSALTSSYGELIGGNFLLLFYVLPFTIAQNVMDLF